MDKNNFFYLFIKENNILDKLLTNINLTDEELCKLLETKSYLHVLNLFDWNKSKEGYEFWLNLKCYIQQNE